MNKRGDWIDVGGIISLILFLVIFLSWIIGGFMFTVHREIKMKENTLVIMDKDCNELIIQSTNCPLQIFFDDFFHNLGTHYFGCWDEDDIEKVLRAKGCFEYGVEIKDG